VSISSTGRSMAASDAFARLSACVEEAGGCSDTLKEIAWRIGAHPLLLAHDRIFANLLEALRSEIFNAEALDWAGPWRHRIAAWIELLELIDAISPQLRGHPELVDMFRAPRHAQDHPVLRTGVGRHPIAAALFNRHEASARVSGGSPFAAASSGAAISSLFVQTRAHALAIYFEARSRAARGLDDFMRHDSDREFASVPLHAGPVGLALRQLSLNDYGALLAQLPAVARTPDAARQIVALNPDFSGLRGNLKGSAARYIQDLQSYMACLPALVSRTNLASRSRLPTDREGGSGGREPRPGWVGFEGTGIWRLEDPEWAEDAPTLTLVSLPDDDGEPDGVDEEVDGDAPWSTRDQEIVLYDACDLAAVLSRLRFMQLAFELRSQGFLWSFDVASAVERAHAMRVAQAAIDQAHIHGTNRSATLQHLAAGGLMVKAAALYGWTATTTAAVRIHTINKLDHALAQSLCYVRQEHVLLLAVEGEGGLEPAAFLVPATSPNYRTRLTAEEEAVGRPRQLAFLLQDLHGIGHELLAFATRFGRMDPEKSLSSRVLGIETPTAQRLAEECLAQAQDPINQDARARLTMGRLSASIQAAVMATHGDPVAGWQIRCDGAKSTDARLFYTQLRASLLPHIHLQALQRLDGGIGESQIARARALGELQDGWVGCRLVASLDRVRGLLTTLRKWLEEPLDLGSRSRLRSYHNDYVLLAWLTMALPLALRAARSGFAVIHQVEERRGLYPSTATEAFGLAEKHNSLQDKSRLLPLPHVIVNVVDGLEQHNATILRRLDLMGEWRTLPAEGQRLFVIEEDESLSALQPAFIRRRLGELGLPVGVNFGRALLRTEWLDQGAPARCIDAVLGHFGRAQDWFSKYSSHDPADYLDEVGRRTAAYLDALGLRATDSQCVRASERALGVLGGWQLPSGYLKPPASSARLKPMHQRRSDAPALAEPRKSLWAEVRRSAATSDKVLLSELLWFLMDSGNAHARLLTRTDGGTQPPADAASACELEHEVLVHCQRHRLPRTQLASWLRLLLAAQAQLAKQTIGLVPTKLAAINTRAESPVSTAATMKLPDLARWQAALFRFVRAQDESPVDDEHAWTVAIGFSAAANGMALDIFMLSQLFEQLATPGPRRLKLCGGERGFSFMQFQLPSAAPGGQQLVRWFLDPLTELLILRAPPFATTPTLRGTSRAIGTFLKRFGCPGDHSTGSWRQVRAAARALWSTRVPQHVVQTAMRTISTTSLVQSCFERLFGTWELTSPRSGARLGEAAAAPAHELTLDGITFDPTAPAKAGHPSQTDDARKGEWVAAGAEIDFVTLGIAAANPWLHAADQALHQPHDEVVARLHALRDGCAEGSFARGAVAWLARAAASLIETANVSEGDPMLGLRRTASTFLPHLVAECGNLWLDSMDETRQGQVLGGITHELESGASRQDLKRGLKLLLQHEESLQHLMSIDEDIEDPRHEASVDARLLSLDEYEETVHAIKVGIEPPLSAQDRTDLEDILDLGLWSGARPREYLEARLGDMEPAAGSGSDLLVREYTEHGLKTIQATRRVPLSLLAPAAVSARISGRVQRLLAAQPDSESVRARQQLLFAPSPGIAPRQHHDRLLALLRQILRQVTGDPKFRVYNLRHSFVNLLFMAMASDGSEVWARLWAKHPVTLKHVTEGSELRQRLLGTTDRTDRRAMLAITKLAGHLAAATSFMHYIHVTAFIQLQAVHRFAGEIPKVVFAAIAGISRGTFSEQSARGLGEVLHHARRRAGWTAAERSVGSGARGSEKGGQAWLSFDELRLMLDARAAQGQPVAQIAAHFSREEATIEAMISRSVEAAEWLGAEVQTLDSDGGPVALIAEVRMNEAERAQLWSLCCNIEDLWLKKPQLAVQGIAVIMERTTRLHAEIALDNSADARVVLNFLHACGVGQHELEIVLRRRTEDMALPPWMADGFGPFASPAVRLGAPDTKTANVTLHRWVRLRLIDRAGHAISQVFRRAMFTAFVNMQPGRIAVSEM